MNDPSSVKLSCSFGLEKAADTHLGVEDSFNPQEQISKNTAANLNDCASS